MVLFDCLLGKKPGRPNARTRRLAFDHLEGRELLAVAPIEMVLETAPIPATDQFDLVSEIAPLAEPIPTDSEPTYNQYADDGGGTGGGGGEEQPQPSPPYLYDFRWDRQTETLYTFSGSVLDNEDPFALTVYFGGIISGEICGVNPDGRFSFSIEISNPSGVVTAMVQDGEGLWSNQLCTYM